MLNIASKAARYLQLVNPAAESSRRNDDPVIFAAASSSSPHIRVYGNLWQSSLDCRTFLRYPNMVQAALQRTNATISKYGVRNRR